MTEQWRPVVGFEGMYEVSDLGRVVSLRRGRRLVRKLHIDACGYLRITIKIGSRTVNRRVHNLVAESFIGPRPAGLVARHWDGNHLNNSPTNLRYGTVAENVQDMLRHGRQRNARKTKCIRGHRFTNANTRIEPNGARKCRKCCAAKEAARRAARREAA